MRRVLCAALVVVMLLSGCATLNTEITTGYSENTGVVEDETVCTTELELTEPTVPSTECTTATTEVTEPTSGLVDIEINTTEPTSELVDIETVPPTEPAPELTDIETVTPTEPTVREPVVEKTVSQLVDEGVYMLIGGFGFYKGSVDMSEIRSITFSQTAPKSYDECWNANLADTGDIKGYRVGNDVTIVGKHIYANSRCSYMFAAVNNYGGTLWGSLSQINGLELLNMSRCTTMQMMFAGGKFTELNGIGQWDVSSVTNMSMVFSWCTELTSLDIAGWDVSKVKNFSGMFQGNSWVGDMKLQYLDVSKWNTSSAVKMNHVFYGCSLLTNIPIENWNVSNVTTFSHMFADCYGVQSLDFSKWNTSSVISFDAFLNDCRSLVTIDVSGLDTATCKQFSQMFEACISLQHIYGLETWDVSNASTYAFEQMFHCCYELQELDLSNWHAVPDDTAMMFKKCYKLCSLDLSGLDMSQCGMVHEMFMNCTSLTEIKWMDEYDFSSVDGYDSMYEGASIAEVNTDATVDSSQVS